MILDVKKKQKKMEMCCETSESAHRQTVQTINTPSKNPVFQSVFK